MFLEAFTAHWNTPFEYAVSSYIVWLCSCLSFSIISEQGSHMDNVWTVKLNLFGDIEVMEDFSTWWSEHDIKF